MLFDTFLVNFAKRVPEVSLNDRFYKVFLSTFPIALKHRFTKGFDVLQSRKTHSTFTENLMLFDTFRVHFAKRAPKVSLNDMFYKVLESMISQVRFIYNGNDFLLFLWFLSLFDILDAPEKSRLQMGG